MNTTLIPGDEVNTTEVTGVGPCARFPITNITVLTDCGLFPPQIPFRRITGLRFALWGVVMPIIAVFGLVGNSLTIMVLRRQSLNSTFLVFLRMLAVSDILVVVLVPAHSTMETYLAVTLKSGSIYYKNWMTGTAVLCLYFLSSTSFTWNVWLSLAITVDRFISICFPLRASRIRSPQYAWRTIVFTAIFVVVFRIPHYLTREVISCGLPGCYKYHYTWIGEMAWYRMYRAWPTSLVNFIIPLCLLCVLNACVLYKLSKFATKRKAMTSVGQADLIAATHRKEREFNLAIALVIIVFIVCQTPVFLEAFHSFKAKDTASKVLAYSINNLIVLNSSVNIFIYTAVGKSFRKELMQMISCKR